MYSYRKPAASSASSGECSTNPCDTAGYRYAAWGSLSTYAVVSNSPTCPSYLYANYANSTSAGVTTYNIWLATLIAPTPAAPTAAAAVYDILSGTGGNAPAYLDYSGVVVSSSSGAATEFPSAADINGNLSAVPPSFNAACRLVYSATPVAPPPPTPPSRPPPPIAGSGAASSQKPVGLSFFVVAAAVVSVVMSVTGNN